MAAKFDVESKKSDLHSFFPQDIDVKAALNGRSDLPDIDWLVVSILTQGQLQNAIVRKDGDKPSLGLGFSRWRAVSFINELVASKTKRAAWIEAHTVKDDTGNIIEAAPSIPSEPLRLRCEFKQWSELEMFLANISENLIRNPPTDLDNASNVARLDKWGVDHATIAKTYRRSVPWVKKCLSIASVEPEVKKAVKDGRVKIGAVAAIAKLSADMQREKVKGEGKVEISAPVASKVPTRAAIAKMRDKFEDAAISWLEANGWECRDLGGWKKGDDVAETKYEALDIEGIE